MFLQRSRDAGVWYLNGETALSILKRLGIPFWRMLMTNHGRRHGSLIVLAACFGLALAVFSMRASLDPLISATLKGRLADARVSEGDQPRYIDLAQYFRGEVPQSRLRVPFAYRVLPAYLVARLPVGEIRVGFRVLNLIAVSAAGWLMFLLVRTSGLGPAAAYGGAILYIVSFPVFYYAPDCSSDPLAMTFLVASLLSILRGSFPGYVVTASLGVLCRETNLAAVLIFAACEGLSFVRVRSADVRAVVRLVLGVLVPVAISLVPRFAFADLSGFYVTTVNVQSLLSNLSRPRAFLTGALALWFLLPTLALCCFRRDIWMSAVGLLRPRAKDLLRIAGVVLVWIPLYALTGAHLDGRFYWVLYVPGVPITMACASAWWGTVKNPAQSRR